MFTAPADGSYVIRVIDSRGQSGERYIFRLTIRKPRPDFRVNLVGANPTVNAGSGQQFKVQADRLDYFDGDIRVDITGVPPGFTVTTPLVIQAGHLESQGILYALEGAPQPTMKNAGISKISAAASVDGREVVHDVGGFGTIKLGAKPSVVVHLQPAQQSAAAIAAQSKPRPQRWVVVDPASFVSKGGATLTKQADNSLLAGGANPDKDSYTIVARTDLRNIRAVRLEVLGDPSLPAGSPGRSEDIGNFVLSQIRLSAGPQIDFTLAAPVTFQSATADYSQRGFPVAAAIDGKGASGWAIGIENARSRWSVMRKGDDPSHTATFQTKSPIDFPDGTILTFTLDQLSGSKSHNLGRFRLSVLADEPPVLEPPPPIPEVVIAPGTTTTCKLTIDRRGFAGSLEFDVNDLPHGVIVDNIGLNGILIPEGQNEQTVYLTAASWVAPIDRLFFAVAKGAGAQASLPVWLRVRRPGGSAKSEQASARR
jgi:hypothetical protein